MESSSDSDSGFVDSERLPRKFNMPINLIAKVVQYIFLRLTLTFSYPENSFYGYLEAAIESSSAKTLAQPTLLVQEGQEAEVVTGTNVITGVNMMPRMGYPVHIHTGKCRLDFEGQGRKS